MKTIDLDYCSRACSNKVYKLCMKEKNEDEENGHKIVVILKESFLDS